MNKDLKEKLNKIFNVVEESKEIYPDVDEKIYKKHGAKNMINKDGSLKVDKTKISVKEALKPFRLTRSDVKHLMSIGYEKSDIAQIQRAANSFKTTYEIDGKRVTRDEAIEKLGREKFLNGLSRSAFHWSSSQASDDGIEVGFDSSKFFESKINEEISNWEQHQQGLAMANKYIKLIIPIFVPDELDLELVAYIFQNKSKNKGIYGFELVAYSGSDSTLIEEGDSNSIDEIIELCINAIKVFDENNNTNIIYDVKPLEPSQNDINFLKSENEIIESKVNETEKENYKGYTIYNTEKDTVFVNKINNGYSIWSFGNIVKNPKEIIDNIEEYENEGGSTFVNTKEELKKELSEFGITESVSKKIFDKSLSESKNKSMTIEWSYENPDQYDPLGRIYNKLIITKEQDGTFSWNETDNLEHGQGFKSAVDAFDNAVYSGEFPLEDYDDFEIEATVKDVEKFFNESLNELYDKDFPKDELSNKVKNALSCLFDLDDEGNTYITADDFIEYIEDLKQEDPELLDDIKLELGADFDKLLNKKLSTLTFINESKMNEGYLGLSDVEYIHHGAWSDGEIKYNGFLYNYYDLEQGLLDSYEDDDSDLSFDDWIKENKNEVYSILDYLYPTEAYAVFDENNNIIVIYGDEESAMNYVKELDIEIQEDGFFAQGSPFVAKMEDNKWVGFNVYDEDLASIYVRDVKDSDWQKIVWLKESKTNKTKKENKMNETKDSTIKIFLTNLGKYNEGDLVGEWVTLPVDDFQPILDRIGIDEEYEEWFITDYEAPFKIGEYDNIYELNEIAEAIENFTETELEVLKTYEENGYDMQTAIEKVRDNDYLYIEGRTEEDLAYNYIDMIGSLDDVVSKADQETYFDYEAFGRDLVLGGDYSYVDDVVDLNQFADKDTAEMVFGEYGEDKPSEEDLNKYRQWIEIYNNYDESQEEQLAEQGIEVFMSQIYVDEVGYDVETLEQIVNEEYETKTGYQDNEGYVVEVYSERELAEYIVDNIYGSVSELGENTLHSYFDYEAFGRDLSYDFYQTDNGWVRLD